ncbi:hypothetical protein MNBD_NITROSPINAE02-2131 [hydrothermal vent metagenome]|uniref:PilZ domain-containing protein n=1 Tax=hydrothermal vent metagenome TaxID=652676 RepID=A0A3B1C987_9ZZZZ
MSSSDSNDAAGERDTIYVYPILSSKFQCPSCGVKTTVTFSKPLSKKVTAKCRKCGAPFKLSPDIRNTYRKDMNITADLYRKPAGEEARERAPVKVMVNEISQGGLGITVTEADMQKFGFQSGEFLFLRLSLPLKTETRPVKVKVKIVNAKRNPETGDARLGLEFRDIGTRAEREIGFFLWN